MFKEIKPIKRSKQLAPLSREHHDGLMYVWKIREVLLPSAVLYRSKVDSFFEADG